MHCVVLKEEKLAQDGSDFIGGNFVSSLNASTTLPVFFENNQNLDASILRYC